MGLFGLGKIFRGYKIMALKENGLTWYGFNEIRTNRTIVWQYKKYIRRKDGVHECTERIKQENNQELKQR